MAIRQLKSFTNSKVSSHKVLKDSKSGGLGMGGFGKNTHKTNVSFKSGTKGVKTNGK